MKVCAMTGKNWLQNLAHALKNDALPVAKEEKLS
jgi:hypothetical protein